jgi:hypothetical protein
MRELTIVIAFRWVSGFTEVREPNYINKLIERLMTPIPTFHSLFLSLSLSLSYT